MHNVVAALTIEGETLSNALHSVPEDQLDRITNCPPWTLAELVVHTAGSISLTVLKDAAPGLTPREAADYYRRPERGTKEYRERNVERAQQLATNVLQSKSAAACFDDTLRRTLEILYDADLNRVIDVDGVGPMRLGDWLTSRVISVAAHGLDVAITVDRQPWTTEPALQVMRPVFVSLLGAEPPVELNWSEQTFFATATGRRELTSDDRRTLGSQADLFPLLS